jgi:hypothetical protein
MRFKVVEDKVVLEPEGLDDIIAELEKRYGLSKLKKDVEEVKKRVGMD